MIVDRLPDAAPGLGTTRLLAVDGLAGAGKTGLARAVGARLGAAVVHLDDAYPGWTGLAAGVRAVRAGVLEPLVTGRPGGYRRWDWHAGAPGGWQVVTPSPVLVLEGVGASIAARGLSSLTVWVEATTAVRRRRALARDGAVFAPHWSSWAAQEEILFGSSHPDTQADLVIDNNEEMA